MDHLKNKTILLVNVGMPKKKHILQELKKLGVKIIALDKEKSWAQPYVDHWIIADTYNHFEAKQNLRVFLMKNPRIKIDGALTFWEDDVFLLAKICHEHKLRGNSIDASLNSRDKFKMQEILKNCGLPHIKQCLLKSESDLEAAIKDIGFPAVIKPVYGSDSQFVVCVNNKQEALDAYKYICKHCTPDYDPIYKYNKNLFLFQEYIEGHEFSLEAYAQHGVPHIVGIHEKTSMELPFFMETGDYLPPRIEEEDEQELVKIGEAVCIVLGITDSLANIEIKLTKHGPKIIEAASRMGGDYTYENVWHVHRFDLIQAACEIAVGVNIIGKPKPADKCVLGKFFIPKTSGIIDKISGVEDIKKNKSVVDITLNKQIGDSVSIPPDGFENIGWVVTEGDSYAEAESAMDDVMEKIKIEVIPFKSYSSVGRTQRKNRFSSASLAKPSKIEIIRYLAKNNLRKLHIGIACNVYQNSNKNAVEQDLMSVGKNIEKTLKERGYKVTFFDFNNMPKTFAELKSSDVGLVFNVCERINDSSLLEPHAAAVLDILQIPYTGSNPFTLGLCIDKIRVKKLLAYHNIPTPKWDYAFSMKDEISEDLQYPLIIKPANTDNSIGITNDSVVTNKAELQQQLKKVIVELGSPALVEEYIEGDEYDVAIIGNDAEDLRVLPLSRWVFKAVPKGQWHIFAYDAKWSKEAGIFKHVILQRPPKNINKKLESLISEIALDTYNILDCHDYGRVELRVDAEGNPYVLELNPNPSINIGDCVPEAAKLTGFEYGDFLEEVMRMAIKRYQNKPPYYHLQTNLL